MNRFVRQHDFNTRWWGAPAGIVSDPAFFMLDEAQQDAELGAFAWVEFRTFVDEPDLDHQAISRAGFFQADTQINYRLRLPASQQPDSLSKLTIEFADEHPFSVDAGDIASFEHERYFKLPGATGEKINERYITWSNEQIARAPACCLRVRQGDRTEGWYLGDDSGGKGLHLTLAMLSKNSGSSGLLLFLKAYEAYANRGHRLGWASFSVQNTPVHNIYANIGARFLRPTGCWLWIRD